MGLMKKIYYKLAGTSEELEKIYEEKGFCDEYIESYKALHKRMKLMDYITLADAYISLERYDDAEETLNNIKLGIFPSDDDKGLYIEKRIELFVCQKKYQDALALLAKENKFLNIFFSTPVYTRMAVMYYDAAAVTLAANGQLEAAQHYHQLEKKNGETYDKSGIYSKLTYVHMLKAAGIDAEAEEAYKEAKSFLENYDTYKYHWQKDYYLRLLESYMK